MVGLGGNRGKSRNFYISKTFSRQKSKNCWGKKTHEKPVNCENQKKSTKKSCLFVLPPAVFPQFACYQSVPNILCISHKFHMFLITLYICLYFFHIQKNAKKMKYEFTSTSLITSLKKNIPRLEENSTDIP